MKILSKIKKLLTLEDLAKFCKEHKFSKFSSKDSGYQLSVQVPATFEVEDSEYKDDTILFGKVKVFHIGPNRNGSSVTKEAAQNALGTIAYKPLLANFCEIDGVKDFTSHDMEFNEDGSVIYLERQIGCFTADPPVIQYDETTEKEFVFAKVAIPREYTDACEIIERKNGTKVSAELIINEMNYSAKDNILELTDVIFQGATCLGRDPETGENVEEGMQGARLDIIDFSKENNSITANAEFNNILIDTLSKLNATLEKFNNIASDFNQKGGEKKMNKFAELLELYELTEADIDFEHDNMSDEDLEAAFNEHFGSAEEFVKKKGDDDSQPVTTNEDDDNDDDDESQSGGGENPEGETHNNDETDDDSGNESSDGDFKKKKRRCSVNTETGTVEFELSFDDIRSALYGLISATESEDSYSWIVEVYEDHMIYQKDAYTDDGWTSKFYRQSYTKNGDDVYLSGDPVEVFAEFVTESEKTALDMIRTQYEELKAFKDKYDAEVLQAQKDEILNDEKYAVLNGNEQFEQLKKDAKNFSVEDVEVKAKLIFADAVMADGEKLEKKNKKIGFNFAEKSKKAQAYSGLFDK